MKYHKNAKNSTILLTKLKYSFLNKVFRCWKRYSKIISGSRSELTIMKKKSLWKIDKIWIFEKFSCKFIRNFLKKYKCHKNVMPHFENFRNSPLILQIMSNLWDAWFALGKQKCTYFFCCTTLYAMLIECGKQSFVEIWTRIYPIWFSYE